MTSRIDVRPASVWLCFFFYLSLGLVWVRDMGKNNGNDPVLVNEKTLSHISVPAQGKDKKTNSRTSIGYVIIMLK